jgi:hypothetical protein
MSSKGGKKITWGYPVKSWDKACRKLERDLKFCGTGGKGDCAMLDLRHPGIQLRRHKDGSEWFHIMVDDIPLPLANA